MPAIKRAASATIARRNTGIFGIRASSLGWGEHGGGLHAQCEAAPRVCWLYCGSRWGGKSSGRQERGRDASRPYSVLVRGARRGLTRTGVLHYSYILTV